MKRTVYWVGGWVGGLNMYRWVGGWVGGREKGRTDEKDNVPMGVLHFLEHALQPVLEFASIGSTRNESTHVQRNHPAAFERVGYVPGH